MRRLLVWVALMLLGWAAAHPMPNSAVLLDVHQDTVGAEAQIPLSELGLALKKELTGEPEEILAAHRDLFRTYLTDHVHPLTPDGRPWQVDVDELSISDAEQTATGPYQELVARLTLTPPAGADTRAFTLSYDAVVHQVITHKILVSVRQDWATGVTNEHPAEVGVIGVNPVDNTVAPLSIDRRGGTLWSGFAGMFRLGVSHISEGTDHLLFLLTLILPAPLLAAAGRWGRFKGVRPSLLSILKIVTAFTVGHSLTLIVGTLSRLELPAQPIEAAIALSILVSALHALHPIFPNREVLIAGGFGLIHGMAFSFTLAELDLSPAQMALSLLGFNLGIEVMQLLIIAVTMPWLIVLARTSVYTPVRILGASIAAIASLAWLGERLGFATPLSTFANGLGPYGPWVVVGLAGLALFVLLARGVRGTLTPRS